MTLKNGFKNVSCASNPYDVRPALDVLQDEITRRAQNGPLVVLMGECHDTPSHMALRQGLIARLLGSTSLSTSQHSPRLAYGMEYAHNVLERRLRDKNLKVPVPQTMRGRISAADPDGVQFLRAFQAVSEPFYAPKTRKNFLSFLQHHAVSSRGNDVAWQHQKDGFFVDQSDPVTRNLLGRYAEILVGTDIPVAGNFCMNLRNRMIAEQSLTHMQDRNVNIYLQECGMDHIFGRTVEGLSYRDSLSALYNTAGVDVLPVYIDTQCDPSRSPTTLEGSAQNLLQDKGIVVEGMSEECFYKTSSRNSEMAHLRRLNQHSGGEVAVFAQDGFLKKWWHHRQLRADLAQWVASVPAREQSPAP